MDDGRSRASGTVDGRSRASGTTSSAMSSTKQARSENDPPASKTRIHLFASLCHTTALDPSKLGPRAAPPLYFADAFLSVFRGVLVQPPFEGVKCFGGSVGLHYQQECCCSERVREGVCVCVCVCVCMCLCSLPTYLPTYLPPALPPSLPPSLSSSTPSTSRALHWQPPPCLPDSIPPRSNTS